MPDGLREDPKDLLAEAVVLGSSTMIEASEARGQQALVESDLLPTDTNNTDDDFIALGFTFGDPVEGDPIFRPATLPEGWKGRASDHSMWTHIYDADGFRRVSIFYKAAFYDRSAHMSLSRTPTTDAQDTALASSRDSLPRGEREWPRWSMDEMTSREEDRAIVAVYKRYEVHPWPQPEIVYERRTVVVLADGTVESDATEEVVSGEGV